MREFRGNWFWCLISFVSLYVVFARKKLWHTLVFMHADRISILINNQWHAAGAATHDYFISEIRSWSRYAQSKCVWDHPDVQSLFVPTWSRPPRIMLNFCCSQWEGYSHHKFIVIYALMWYIKVSHLSCYSHSIHTKPVCVFKKPPSTSHLKKVSSAKNGCTYLACKTRSENWSSWGSVL